MRMCAALIALGLVSTGCDPDTAVFVEGRVLTPSVTAQAEVLGTSYSGAFVLELHLGDRAADASQVTVGQFSLQNADQTADIIAPLPAVTDEPTPIDVGVDSTVTVPFSFSSGTELLSAETYDALCAGSMVISGSIDDSLASGSTTVVSEPFAAICN